ncbi:hypothetical protein COOONC_09672 [Cooperia oncophora]
MQKLKSKRARKKEIDNRASKDRKTKCVPILKLVNFHPAMPEMVEWRNHETRNELFKLMETPTPGKVIIIALRQLRGAENAV